MTRTSRSMQSQPSAPATNSGDATAGAATLAFAQLLKIESDARRASSAEEIDALLVNEGRRLARARQVFVLEISQGRPHLIAATGMAHVDRSTPMARWIEEATARIIATGAAASSTELSLSELADPADELTLTYPFRHALWQPLWSFRGKPRLGALYLREVPWTETDRAITARIGESTGHAREFLKLAGRRRPSFRWRPATAVMCALATLALMFVRVPMSVLAPLEVVARNAEVVAMPHDGTVRDVLVRPSDAVQAGMPVVRLVDMIQRNRSEVADREVAVAEARLEKSSSLAFTDPRGRHELGIARAELALKRAEAQHARDMLGQTEIKARTSGIAIFSDPKDLEGKPLSTGERLMLVGRESDTEFRISLPVADTIVLRPNLKVRAFLDSDPLAAVEGSLAHIDYQVRVDDQQIASFRLTAHLKEPAASLKLGSRGTAQILGDPVPLAVYLLRRPLAAMRQWLGV